MPFDGSGNYALSDTIAPATNADANELQAILTDIGTGLNKCVVADGQSSITGALKGSDGTAALPAYSFNADLNSGFYRIGSDNIGLSLGGTKRIDFGTAGTAITGTFDATSYVSPKVVLSSDAGATVGPTVDLYRDSASPAVSDFIGSVDFNGRDSGAAKQLYAEIIAQITDPTAASEDAIIILRTVIAGVLTDVLKSSATGLTGFGALAISGALSGVTTLSMSGAISGVTAPTVQRLITGGPLTYTAPAGVVRQRVRMSAGGGGGAARATNNGVTGGTTSLQVNGAGTAWTCIGGSGGIVNSNGGTGGTGGTDGSTGTKICRFDGGDGGAGTSSSVANITPVGGAGGSNPFGGGGARGATGTGASGKTNTGAGGQGAGSASTTISASGGAAGEYVEFWVTGMTTATYTVGAAGTGGAAGTVAGGDGAAGIIIIEEFYS